ncbi:hypothetical protein [Asticcacaulis biprosthecium]|nr:hypothetical protein [Asticcacaulis biprosthecium]
MKYLVLPFLLVGIGLMIFSVVLHPNPAILIPTAIACWFAFLIQSPRWLAIAFIAGIAAGCIAGEGPVLLGIAAANVCAWLSFWIGSSARCPRCQYTLFRSRRWGEDQPPHRWCMMCGRDRKGVWPFQYQIKPEPWDGRYHDEGGGPGNPDSLLDWWRGVMFRRLPKRWRRG